MTNLGYQIIHKSTREHREILPSSAVESIVTLLLDIPLK